MKRRVKKKLTTIKKKARGAYTYSFILYIGYIDLSKRRVTPEDIIKCEEKYNKSKAVHSILRHVAEKNDLPLKELYEIIGWPLYKKFGHAYDAFKMAIV